MAERYHEKERRRKYDESQRRIQLREYEGKAYIALDDIPLVPYECIEQLNQIRKTVYGYWAAL